MSSPFADPLGGDSPVAAPSIPSFDDGFLGNDSNHSSQQFDSFSNFAYAESVEDSVGDSSMFTSQPIPDTPSPPPIYAPNEGVDADLLDVNGEPLNGSYQASYGPVLSPPTEMQPEESFALREWRRQNTIRLEEKEKREKQLLSEIIDEAEAYKVEFHKRRQASRESNIIANREREKLFLSSHERFHCEADKNYWKTIAELIPKEVPTIEKKGKKKDNENKPSVVVVQGPKPGKPTDMSRMRHIISKLKHDTPIHLKSAPPPLPVAAKDAKTGDSPAATAVPPKVAATTTSPEAVAVA